MLFPSTTKSATDRESLGCVCERARQSGSVPMNSPGSTARWCLRFSADATPQSWPIQFPTFRRCFADRPMLPTMRNPTVPIAGGGGITVGAIGDTIEAGETIEAGTNPLPSHIIGVPPPLCSGLIHHYWGNVTVGCQPVTGATVTRPAAHCAPQRRLVVCTSRPVLGNQLTPEYVSLDYARNPVSRYHALRVFASGQGPARWLQRRRGGLRCRGSASLCQPACPRSSGGNGPLRRRP